MKKIFLILISSLMLIPVWAGGEKVVESSGKEPKWIYAMQKDYIITSGESSTLEEAQEKAMLNLKKQILSSIAENVKSESSFLTTEESRNNQYDIASLYLKKIETKGANIPFLQEISVSKADDYYWEKIKRDKQFFYRYHIKYPFSQFDLMRMADDFRMREQKLDHQLQAYIDDDFTSYSTIEQMEKRLTELKTFEQSLMEEDSRREVCKTVQTQYRKQAENVTIQLVSATREQTVFALYYGDKQVTTQKKPQLRSNCLTGMTYQRDGENGVVRYDYNTACYPDEQNWLEIQFTVNGKKVSNRFYIK